MEVVNLAHIFQDQIVGTKMSTDVSGLTELEGQNVFQLT